MHIRENLLSRIDGELKTTGESARAFCLRAGIDHKVIGHLRRGENVTLATLEKIEDLLSSKVSAQ